MAAPWSQRAPEPAGSPWIPMLTHSKPLSRASCTIRRNRRLGNRAWQGEGGKRQVSGIARACGDGCACA
eukprot:6189080-Pleurochrysis_carterae.AAC.1